MKKLINKIQKVFGKKSIKIISKNENPLITTGNYFKSFSLPTGKWYKFEAYYKVIQRGGEVQVDNIRITKVKNEKNNNNY